METASYGKTVTVTGFDPSIACKDLRIISGAMAYDSPDTGETIILIVHQAIHNPNVRSLMVGESSSATSIRSFAAMQGANTDRHSQGPNGKTLPREAFASSRRKPVVL